MRPRKYGADIEIHSMTKYINGHGDSLSDVETLITYSESSDPKLQDYPEPFRAGFFRFSLGLEDPEDIIADLTQAFQAAGLL